MPENHSPNARLHSWKEIAEYLKRDVRTAIRWEKERRLPVHRIPGGKRQAVFAYPQEIDAWLDSSEPNMLQNATDTGEEPNENEITLIDSFSSSTQAKHKTPISLRLKFVISSAGLVMLGLLAGFMFTRSHTRVPIRSVSKQVTEDGQLKFGIQSDGTNFYFNITEGALTKLAFAPMSGSPLAPIQTPFTSVILQDLSKDGKTLLITSHEGIAREGQLWTVPVQGGTGSPIGAAICNVARWSPDNRQIACAFRMSISIWDTDGSNVRTIKSFSSPVASLIWMPDGKGLRFSLYDPTLHTYSPWEITFRDEKASRSELVSGLPTDGSCCPGWAWMQDDKTFLYTTMDADGNTHLLMQEGRSSREIQLPGKLSALSGFSLIKKALYLEIAGAFRGELLKFDEKQRGFLTFLSGLSANYVSFSKDGQWLTYTRSTDNTLWRSRADGSQPLQLTKPPMEVQLSSWSPDGRHIAYMGRNPGKPFRIYLIDRNGGEAHEAARGDDNQGAPSWSPDGKTIVYGNVFVEETQDGWIREIDLNTGKVRILPESQNFRTARWSPDGKYIAALRWQTRELVLFNMRTKRWQTLADSITGDNIVWSSDSQFVYVDSPRQSKPVLERIHVPDGKRLIVTNLLADQKTPEQLSWIGLDPKNTPIFFHPFVSTEIYEVKWDR